MAVEDFRHLRYFIVSRFSIHEW